MVLVDKAKRELAILKEGEEAARFPASFGIDPDSDKFKAFDAATPEGLYFITYKKPNSRFHRFVGISYPSLEDAAKGLAQGVISPREYEKIARAIQKSGAPPCNTGLGCGIGIHGGGVFRPFGNSTERDWTEGCIALNNEDMEKVFHVCRPGDPVIIFNSRRNLYGIIRPFTRPKDLRPNGAPVCPGGICSYQAEIPTSPGRIVITLKEGRAYGKSLYLKVFKDDSHGKLLLELDDRNGDGHICGLDRVSGPLAEGIAPNAAYQRVKEAVINALLKGDILNP